MTLPTTTVRVSAVDIPRDGRRDQIWGPIHSVAYEFISAGIDMELSTVHAKCGVTLPWMDTVQERVPYPLVDMPTLTCGDCYRLEFGDWVFDDDNPPRITCVRCGYTTLDDGVGRLSDVAHDDICDRDEVLQ